LECGVESFFALAQGGLYIYNVVYEGYLLHSQCLFCAPAMMLFVCGHLNFGWEQSANNARGGQVLSLSLSLSLWTHTQTP